MVIDPDLFAREELADRKAAVDWTKGALRDGESERGILMQLQTTGWSLHNLKQSLICQSSELNSRNTTLNKESQFGEKVEG